MQNVTKIPLGYLKTVDMTPLSYQEMNRTVLTTASKTEKYLNHSIHLDDQVPMTCLFSPPKRIAISDILEVLHRFQAQLLLAHRSDCQIHPQICLLSQKGGLHDASVRSVFLEKHLF